MSHMFSGMFGGGGGSTVAEGSNVIAGAAGGAPGASPVLPPPPANPPMFGANATKAKAGGAAGQTFTATAIGGLPQQQPQRTLLGSYA